MAIDPSPALRIETKEANEPLFSTILRLEHGAKMPIAAGAFMQLWLSFVRQRRLDALNVLQPR
jgi:hypothetical protein